MVSGVRLGFRGFWGWLQLRTLGRLHPHAARHANQCGHMAGHRDSRNMMPLSDTVDIVAVAAAAAAAVAVAVAVVVAVAAAAVVGGSWWWLSLVVAGCCW